MKESASSTDVVVVTGVNGGIGKATVHAFAREGKSLILCGRKAGPLEDLKETLALEPGRVDLVCCDIAAVEFPGHIITALAGRQVHALAHVAAISPTMGSGKEVWEINFVATKRLVEALMPHMAPGSATILVASLAGEFGKGFVGIDRLLKHSLKTGRLRTGRLLLASSGMSYTMSKRAVQMYARFMAPAFGANGWRIVSLSPGIIDTALAKREREHGFGSGEGKEAKLYNMACLGRMGRSEEVASVITFLASPAASYITGVDLLVDGGTMANVEKCGGVLRTFV